MLFDHFRQCRQEIEDTICSVILKHQKLSNEKTKSSFHMKPQVLASIHFLEPVLMYF